MDRVADGRSRGWLALGGSTLPVTLWLIVPWRPAAFSPDQPYLDPSWMVMLHDAFVAGASFGSDFVFTYGPWGFVATRAYFPGTFGWLLAAWVGVSVAIWLGAFAVARQSFRRPITAAAWMIGVALVAGVVGSETATIAVATLFLATVFVVEQTRTTVAAALALAVALAWLSQVKFTYLVLAAGLMVIVLASSVLRRGTSAWGVAVYVASSAVIWVLGGQSITGVWTFLENSFLVASGYTPAMSLGDLVGRGLTLVFVLCAGATIAYVALSDRARRRAFPALTLGIVWMLFVLFKAGFVREDPQHVVIGLLGVATVAIIIAPTIRRQKAVFRFRFAAGLPLVAIALAAWWTASDQLPAPENPLAYTASQLRTADDVVTFFAHPRRARTERIAGWDRFTEGVRETVPLPHTSGTADLYPHDQLVLIAHGIVRSGRPVAQSYSAYTPRLSELNLEHLESADRPATVFVDIDPIDGRWPASEDAPSLLTILSDYRLSGEAAPYLVFKRAASTGYRLRPVRTLEARMGDPVPVPPFDAGPVWVEIGAKRTLAGRLEDVLYKPAPLDIEATLADGRVVRHRLVPGLGETGFVLSPYIADRADLAKLATPSWRSTLAEDRVVAMKVAPVGDELGGYSDELSVSFSHALFSPPTA